MDYTAIGFKAGLEIHQQTRYPQTFLPVSLSDYGDD